MTLIVSGKAWQMLVAPISGTTDVVVHQTRGKSRPTFRVHKGHTYWVKAPAIVTIAGEAVAANPAPAPTPTTETITIDSSSGGQSIGAPVTGITGLGLSAGW